MGVGRGVSAGLSKGSLANLEDEALEASERDEEEDGERERTRSPYKRPESMGSQVSQASSTTRRMTQEEEEEKDPFDLRDTDSRKLTTEAVCSLFLVVSERFEVTDTIYRGNTDGFETRV